MPQNKYSPWSESLTESLPTKACILGVKLTVISYGHGSLITSQLHLDGPRKRFYRTTSEGHQILLKESKQSGADYHFALLHRLTRPINATLASPGQLIMGASNRPSPSELETMFEMKMMCTLSCSDDMFHRNAILIDQHNPLTCLFFIPASTFVLNTRQQNAGTLQQFAPNQPSHDEETASISASVEPAENAHATPTPLPTG